MHIDVITNGSRAKSALDRASYLRNFHMPKPDSRDDQFGKGPGWVDCRIHLKRSLLPVSPHGEMGTAPIF